MKNVCIVGYGAIGPIHAAALSETENAKLYAVCDVSEEKTKIAQEKYDVTAYTSFEEMLTDKNIDSIHICTPHYLHFDMMKKALECGKSIVCEKPVTMTEAEYDELLSLPGAEKICVVLQNRLNPCIKRFKEIAQDGSLGKVKAAKAFLTWFRNADYYAQDDWHGRWATEGGGVLINQAIHTLDLFSYIIGDVNSVRAQITNFSLPEIEVEDTVFAHLKFDCGATGVFYATNAYAEDSAPEFEVIFENGVVYCKNDKLFLDDVIIEENSPAKLGKAYWGNGHPELIKNYYDKNIFLSPFDVSNTMYTLFGIYESAKSNGIEVKIKEI